MHYRTFYRFRQAKAKLGLGGLVLDLRQFSILLQLPIKTVLVLKVDKTDLKLTRSVAKKGVDLFLLSDKIKRKHFE